MAFNGDTTNDIARGMASIRRSATDSLKLLKRNGSGREESSYVQTIKAAPMPPVISPMPMREPEPVAVPGAGPSVLSVNVEIVGSVNSPDEVHIFGSIDGNVCASALTICSGGSVKGDVIAETVLVHGMVEGRIHGQRVILMPGAVVRGDIIHNSLGVDTGAIFEGISRRSANPLAEAPAGLVAKK